MPKYLKRIIDDEKHTKTGIHEFLRPMSLWESKESNGEVSIMDLFDNPNLNINQCESDLSIYDVIFVACRGGWPEAFKKESSCDKLKVAYSYLEKICNQYASQIDGVKRDPQKVRFLLRSIAENNPVLSKNQTIIDYMNRNFINITRPTYYSYKKALKKLSILEDEKGWTPDIKAKSSMRSATKTVFVDPSLAVTSMNATPKSMENNLVAFESVFETLCIRDLNVYTSSYGGKVSYYRDKSGLKVDCVLHLKDERYGLIECGLGNYKIDEGAGNLLKINKLIEKNEKLKKPNFLAVLSVGKYAYTRRDGVKVIPVGCLR